MSIQFCYNYPQVAREAGFRLRQFKDGPLDWKMLGSYEIERVVRNQSLEEIDKILLHLSEAPLGTVLLDTNILEPAIAKYFIVSQFAIQYLLFCRNFLDETVQDLRESHAEAQMELARANKSLSEANNEILQLHKKMTQMEAIHEVIYPCHLCTKNFANNEALNIHIGRKHNKTAMERKTDTPTAETPKERHRNSDLTLINTIKLELEIKQLKERLNNAEKDIKERKSGNDLKDNSGSMHPTVTETRSVAIQSNLSEEKEKNDAKEYEADDNDAEDALKRNEQLEKLKSKIYSIEEWRATQAANNEDSIAEINRKLTEISKALEGTVDLKHSQQTNEDFHEQPLERKLSVDDLERVLSEKVAEIGRASSEKLEEIVHNMEINYREKLIELEREVKRSQQELQMRETEIRLQKLEKPEQDITSVENEIKKVRKANETVESINDENEDDDDDDANGTYDIETKPKETTSPKEKPTTSKAKTSEKTHSKTEEKSKFIDIQVSPSKEQSSSDDTSISESLSEDNDHQSIEEREKLRKTKELQTAERIESEKLKNSKRKTPKKYTRKDSKVMADKRLLKLGCNMRMKSIPSSTYKRLNMELNEKRNKIKQQYPNFYVMRNKIKKFVDKLCTSKSTNKAERVLTTTATLKPMKISKRLVEEISTRNDEDDESDDDAGNDVKPTKGVTSDDFKKRLESLLSSPAHRPVRKASTTIDQVHEVKGVALPMPMPRKRVMFNTAASSKNSNV